MGDDRPFATLTGRPFSDSIRTAGQGRQADVVPCALFLIYFGVKRPSEVIPVKSAEIPVKSEKCRVKSCRFMAAMGSEKERKTACAE
jgi:hypothetical protein